MSRPRNRRLVSQILAVVFGPGVLWFGGLWVHSLRPLPPMPHSTGRETTWSSHQGAHLPAAEENCRLANTVWHKEDAAQGLQQEVFVADVNGKRTLGWRWRAPWQMLPANAAYPSLLCGTSPWNQSTAALPGLPFHPGEKRVTVDYAINLKASGTYNMAFSLWAVSALPASPSNVKCEVSIWIANSDQLPYGVRTATVTIQGVLYDVYLYRHQHQTSGDHPNEWTYAAFVARTPVLQGPLDLSAFLDRLQLMKVLSSNSLVTDVELGNQVAQGTGIAEIQNFALRME
jgi:hypothetical protein